MWKNSYNVDKRAEDVDAWAAHLKAHFAMTLVDLANLQRIAGGAQLSPDGHTLVGSTTTGLAVELDRAGNRVGTVADGADYSNPALSPDGRLLALLGKDGDAILSGNVSKLLKQPAKAA